MCPSCLAIVPKGESLGDQEGEMCFSYEGRLPKGKMEKGNLEVRSAQQESKPQGNPWGLATRMSLPES